VPGLADAELEGSVHLLEVVFTINCLLVVFTIPNPTPLSLFPPLPGVQAWLPACCPSGCTQPPRGAACAPPTSSLRRWRGWGWGRWTLAQRSRRCGVCVCVRGQGGVLQCTLCIGMVRAVLCCAVLCCRSGCVCGVTVFTRKLSAHVFLSSPLEGCSSGSHK
jgi:hypothetical protein